jgi:hypothetical protein
MPRLCFRSRSRLTLIKKPPIFIGGLSYCFIIGSENNITILLANFCAITGIKLNRIFAVSLRV